ncbi:Slx4p interacting protein, partial [Rhizina undulata]
WVWQNPHISLKIPPSQRLTAATIRTVRGRKKPTRPRMNLHSILANLHLLLRVPAFSRWPLGVKFFSKDVHNTWLNWCKKETSTLRPHITIDLDLRVSESPTSGPQYAGKNADVEEEGMGENIEAKRKSRKFARNGVGGAQALDITNASMTPHLQKSQDLLNPKISLNCNLCRSPLPNTHSNTLVCPHAFCKHVSHIHCLAAEFLRQENEGRNNQEDDILVLPVHGNCPGCDGHTKWIDLVKEHSIRTLVLPSEKKKAAEKAKNSAARKGKKNIPYDSDTSGDEETEDEDFMGLSSASIAGVPDEPMMTAYDDTDMDSDLSDVWSESSLASVKSTSAPRGKGKGKTKDVGKGKRKKRLLTVSEDDYLTI